MGCKNYFLSSFHAAYFNSAVDTKRIVTQNIGGGISETVELNLCDTNLQAVNQALQGISKILGFYKHTVEISTEVSLKDFAKEFYLQRNSKDF